MDYTTTELDLDERRATFVYEAARLHARFLECPIIPAEWKDREYAFKKQFVQLVGDLCSGKRQFRDPEVAHDSWVEEYKRMGWKYGEKYNPKNREHPDLVPYNALNEKEKIKDQVFMDLVKIARDCIW